MGSIELFVIIFVSAVGMIDLAGKVPLVKLVVIGPGVILILTERFYCLNVMDVYTRRVISYPARYKRNQEALMGIIRAWEELGKPDYMQFDNALAFRGSGTWVTHARKSLIFGVFENWGVKVEFNLCNHVFTRRCAAPCLQKAIGQKADR